jgi:hypothetical protein
MLDRRACIILNQSGQRDAFASLAVYLILPPAGCWEVVKRSLLLLCSKCLANVQNSSASSINAFFA